MRTQIHEQWINLRYSVSQLFGNLFDCKDTLWNFWNLNEKKYRFNILSPRINSISTMWYNLRTVPRLSKQLRTVNIQLHCIHKQNLNKCWLYSNWASTCKLNKPFTRINSSSLHNNFYIWIVEVWCFYQFQDIILLKTLRTIIYTYSSKCTCNYLKDQLQEKKSFHRLFLNEIFWI